MSCRCGQMLEGRKLCELCQVGEVEVESSRCGDQVFGSRVTTSTLAGEYVTARDYVGGRASCGKIETSTSCTRRGIREKLWCMTYVLSKRGG